MDELIKEAKELLDNPRTGLKPSSDTNKTRYAILGLIYKAHDLGMDSRTDVPSPKLI